MDTNSYHLEVKIYNEQLWPPDTLVRLWHKMQEDDVSKLFWAHGEPLSLTEFIRFFDQTRLLLLPFFVPEGEELAMKHLAGFMWAEDIRRNRCHAHFCFWKAYHGQGRPLAAVRKGLEILFDFPFTPPLDLVLAVAHAENVPALKLWERLGVRITPEEIPGWYLHNDGSRHAARVGYLTKEAFLRGRELGGANIDSSTEPQSVFMRDQIVPELLPDLSAQVERDKVSPRQVNR